MALVGVILQRPRVQDEPRKLGGRGGRWAWGSGIAAVPLTVVAEVLAWPWGAAIPIAALVALVVLMLAGHRGRSKLSQQAQRLFRERTTTTGGFPYDRESLPDLVVVYTDNDVSDANRSDQAPTSVQQGQTRGQRQQSAPAKDTGKQQRVSFAKVLTDPSYLHLAITGEAGIGKTSLLEFWTHELDPLRQRTGGTRDTRTEQRLRQFVPLLTAARTLVGMESVAECFECPDGTDLLAQPPGPGMRWLVMIDAFDEITDMRDREQVERIVFEAIDQSAGDNAAVKFVLTTRGLTPERWRSFDSRGVTEFRLQPFTFEQLRTFLVRHQTSTRRRTPGSPDLATAEAKARLFLKKWERADNLAELLRLPLLASVAAAVYFEGDRPGGFPSRRVDIYDDAVAHWLAQFRRRLESGPAEGGALALLANWHGGTSQDLESTLRRFLGELAKAHLADGQRSLTDHACEIFGIGLRPKDPPKLAAMRALLEATGLVHELHDDQPRFIHKTFAEYLAAPSQAAQFETTEDWSKGFHDPERRAGTVFAFNSLTPERKRHLIDNTLSDRKHAVMCGWIAAEGLCTLTGAGRIDPELRRELINHCLDSMPGEPGDRWWAVIRMLATIEHGQNRLFEFVETGAWSASMRSQFAGELANHSSQGIELLRSLLDQDVNGTGPALDAAKELLQYDKPKALERLRHLATSPRVPEYRRLAAAAELAEHDLEAGTELLRKYCGDFTFHESYHPMAAGYLAKHSEKEAISLLTAFADNPGRSMLSRTDAAGMLAKYDREAGVSRLRAFIADRLQRPLDRAHAADELIDFDRENALETLHSIAVDTAIGPVHRVRAARLLARHSPDTGRPLLREFASRPTVPQNWRIESAQELDELDPGWTGTTLLQLATDQDLQETFRAQAAASLVRFDRSAGEKILRDIAESPSASYRGRMNAANALAQIDRTAGIALLKRLVEDPAINPDERTIVASFLSNLDDALGPSVLAEVARDPTSTDTDRAWAAGRLVQQDRDLARRHLQQLAEDRACSLAARASAEVALSKLEPETAVPRLLKLCSDFEPLFTSHIYLLNEVALYDPTLATKALRALARDPRASGSIQVEAATALARLGDDSAFLTLAEQVDDNALHRSDQVEAAHQLALAGRSLGIETLRRFASQEATTDHARVTAAAHLCEFDLPTGANVLRECARERTALWDVRLSAAAAIVVFDHEEGMDLLRRAASDEGLLEAARIEAAGRLQPERIAELTLESLAKNPNLSASGRCRAMIELNSRDKYTARPLLRAFLADETHSPLLRVNAAGALARHERAEGLRELKRLIEDTRVPEVVKVEATMQITYLSPWPGLAQLRSFASGTVYEAHVRVEAADYLSRFDRLAGIEALRDLVADVATNDSARVTATAVLTQISPALGFDRLRDFCTDRSLDSIAHLNAIRFAARYDRVTALAQLERVCSDPRQSATTRTWAGITIAELDWPVSIGDLKKELGNAVIDAERLREAAMSLMLWSDTLGEETEKWIAALEDPAD